MTEKTATPVPTQLPSSADPLGEALHYLRMRSVFYCHSELTAPWGAHLPPMPDWYHTARAMSCAAPLACLRPTCSICPAKV